MNNNKIDQEKLGAFVDGELNANAREELLVSLDNDAELRGEVCDITHVNELLNFAYPVESRSDMDQSSHLKTSYVAIVASFLVVLVLGFVAGNLSSHLIGKELVDDTQTVSPDTNLVTNKADKVILYLGKSKKEKFDETLDKAEALLTRYKNSGTQVFVVTSAGGIDLLRTSNVAAQKRIKTLTSLHKGLHFVACNTQIYELHRKGKEVHLVDEAEVAPSAVQFVVDHLKDGWRYIAI